MSFQSRQVQVTQRGHNSSGSSSLQSHPDTWRSYLYPTESGAIAHTAEIYGVWRGGPPEAGNGMTRHAASDAWETGPGPFAYVTCTNS